MRSHRLTELVLVGAGMLAASLVFTWPLPADAAGTLPGLGDPLYNAWALGWVADRAAHGLAGLWDAPIFYPYRATLTYSEPLLGIAAPLAPVYWLSHNAVLLHNVAVWLSFVIAGTGGYVLGRDQTGRRAAGVVSGAIAAFLPYRLAHLAHVQVLMAAWLWWAAWALHQYFEAPSLPRALRVAAFYCLLGLSSLYWAYIGLLPLGTIACLELWRRRTRLGRALGHGLVAAAVCAAAFVPVAMALGAMVTSDSTVQGTVDANSYSADVRAYVSGQPTLLLWGAWLRSGDGETDLFPGLTAMACALLALAGPGWWASARVRAGGDTSTWMYAGLGVVAVVLSLGPAPAYDGRVLFGNPVFPWLAQHVPGFAQLRVPARFVVVAQLALSVLAARGVALWLAARQASSTQAAITAAVLATIIFSEGLGLPVHVDRFWPYQVSGDRTAYHWLSRRPGGPVLELPLDGWGHTHYSMVYQYRTLLHGHPIVNGVSRFAPPLPAMLADPDSPLVEPGRSGDGVAFLRALGVRYVVVHRTWYARCGLGEAIRDELARAAGQAAVDFGDASIIDLGPAAALAPAAAGELPATSIQIAASRGDVSRMIDADRATRWLTGRPQTGADWIEVTLPAAAAVSGVRLQLMGRSLNDYPRGLEISVSPDGERFATVFTGSVLPALGEALRREPAAPSIELRWSATATRRVRLRQTGGATRWYWSVHELRLIGSS